MPRLFTALQVPEAIGQRLAVLRGGLPGARWVEAQDYHITLSFIGDVDDRLADEIILGLGGIGSAPFPIDLQGLDVFGREKPRALYAGLAPSRALLDLQAAQEHLLRRVGARLENRQYTPHVTLARLSRVSPRAAADWLAAHGRNERLSFRIDRFVLMSSRTSKGGGPYLVEETYPLG